MRLFSGGKADFLGRIKIPIKDIRPQHRACYALKDRNCVLRGKGEITVEIKLHLNDDTDAKSGLKQSGPGYILAQMGWTRARKALFDPVPQIPVDTQVKFTLTLTLTLTLPLTLILCQIPVDTQVKFTLTLTLTLTLILCQIPVATRSSLPDATPFSRAISVLWGDFQSSSGGIPYKYRNGLKMLFKLVKLCQITGGGSSLPSQ